MSFILDALKKLEQEKAARRGGNVKISDEILREERRIPRRGKRSLTTAAVAALVVVLVAAAVVAGSIFWMKGRGERIADDVQPEPERRRSLHKNKRLPDRKETAKAPVLSPGPAVGDSRPMSPDRGIVPAKPVIPSALEKGFSKYPQSPSAEPSPTSAPPSGVNLTVSGIAWQETRSARRAVINGDLVPEGASVGGATVKEIYRNRVRFDSGGRQFDVYISGPALGETPAAPFSRPPVSVERELPRPCPRGAQ